MLIDLKPLVRYPDFRRLFFGQLVSYIGTMITYVALPYEVYKLTGSSFAVGLIGLVQLIPILFTAFLGGAYADAVDRRRILMICEALLALCSGLQAWNVSFSAPKIWLIYVIAAFASAINGFHRPAHQAMLPRLVPKEEIPSTSALGSLRSNIASIGGPAIGGLILARYGVRAAFLTDVGSFLFSFTMLAMLPAIVPLGDKKSPSLQTIREGLSYAKSRQELIGTYAVDFIAMVFGMPNALFPAMAAGYGGAKVLGWFYSAPSIGALVATLFSGSLKKVKRHGAGVVVAALVWGVAIVLFGAVKNLPLALFFLGLAGAADMVSVVYRFTIWNETIPDRLRGRLAGVEMLSYLSGPMLGNVESGMVAAATSTGFSVISGGVLCVVFVGMSVLWLPKFWSYHSDEFKGEA
jgi:MFS family permease